jgi:NADH-quinone oxidoreductase subunit L
MRTFVTLIPTLPLLGFVMILLVGKSRPRIAGVVGTAAVGGAFVASVVSFILLLHRSSLTGREVTVHLFTWLHVGAFRVDGALLLDPLSVTMCLFVTGISTLIHLYSTGYMEGERDYTKFFTYLNLFVFSMLILVLANSLALTFVGWEGVGVCSYWLVSYYFTKDAAASAGKKAFLYNRVGDVGLLLAMFLLVQHFGSLNYLDIFARGGAAPLSGTPALLVVLALLLAATGKSAQIPLFNWLPDAMEGPTPVSALIHAATMVTAGVYLLVRMSPVLAWSSTGRATIAVVGGLTAFVAATIATSQRDIKKVLAFSTVSQIGYMVLAVGAGAYTAAIFLMVSHAFFKALLFLGSGSVIHSLHGEQDLTKMGALAKFLPFTFPTFTIGWLAISGIPPFAGFWSKGDVLTNVYEFNKILWALGVLTAVLTAYYMSRLFVLTFRGVERFREITHGNDPHESPWVMTLPLVVLAVLSFLGGILDLPWAHHDSIAGFLAPVVTSVPIAAANTTVQWTLAGVDFVAALAGLAAAFSVWTTTTPWPKYESNFLARVWRWDDAYDATIGRPLTRLATVGHDVIEPRVLDGAVEGLARVASRSASAVSRAQTGFVRHYALVVVAGVSVVVLFLTVRSW